MTPKGRNMLMSSSTASPVSGFVKGAGVGEGLGSGAAEALGLGASSASGVGRVEGFSPQAVRASSMAAQSTAASSFFI